MSSTELPVIGWFKAKFNHRPLRDRRLIFSVITAGLAKIIGVLATLITIPLTLEYLGPEMFGVWMVISGFVSFMMFGDLGLGVGLQNALSEAHGKNDVISPQVCISNAYMAICFIVCCLITCLLLMVPFIPFEQLFKLDGRDLAVAENALVYSIVAFFINMPLVLMQRVLNGIQKTYVANNIALVGSFLSVLSVLFAIYLDLGLVGLSILFLSLPMLPMFVFTIFFFSKNKHLRPRITSFSWGRLSPLLNSGLWTVAVQLIYTARVNVPTVIISATLGLIAVGEYSIALKLTGLASSMIAVALQPLWPVYGSAFHQGDKRWILRTLHKSIVTVLILTVFASIAFYFFGEWMLQLWVGEDLLPSPLLVTGFSLCMIVSSVNVCYSMILNGTSNFKGQALFSFPLVSLGLFMSYLCAQHYGVVGVVFSLFLVSDFTRVFFFRRAAIKVIERIDG